ILAEVAHPRLVQLLDSPSGMGLGDSDERDLFGVTSATRSGKPDPLAHSRKVLGQLSRGGSHFADSSMQVVYSFFAGTVGRNRSRVTSLRHFDAHARLTKSLCPLAGN